MVDRGRTTTFWTEGIKWVLKNGVLKVPDTNIAPESWMAHSKLPYPTTAPNSATVRGGFGWKVNGLTIMQSSNLTRCGLFFQHNHTLAALGFSWYRSSNPDPRKRSSTADMTSSSVQYLFPTKWFYLFWWTENSQTIPNQKNMEGDIPVYQFRATVTHSSHCKIVCRSIILVKQDFLRQVPGLLKCL